MGVVAKGRLSSSQWSERARTSLRMWNGLAFILCSSSRTHSVALPARKKRALIVYLCLMHFKLTFKYQVHVGCLQRLLYRRSIHDGMKRVCLVWLFLTNGCIFTIIRVRHSICTTCLVSCYAPQLACNPSLFFLNTFFFSLFIRRYLWFRFSYARIQIYVTYVHIRVYTYI